MNLSQLQSFAALADTASFTEAADAVNLTQSAVSHALAALERELGVTLLERNRRGVVALTAVGHTVMPHVRALLSHIEAIEQEAKAAKGHRAGKLLLGSIVSFIPPHVLAGVLTSFQQRYPDIEVVLFEGAMHEVGEWLERGVVDAGFVILPAHGIDTAALVQDELCVLLPRGHRLHKQAAVTLEQLGSEGLIMEKTHCALYFLQRMGVDTSLSKPTIRYQASDSATIFAMVREGLGISFVPRSILPKKLEGMAALSFEPPQPLEIGIAVRSRQLASPAAGLFVETAVEWAATHFVSP